MPGGRGRLLLCFQIHPKSALSKTFTSMFLLCGDLVGKQQTCQWRQRNQVPQPSLFLPSFITCLRDHAAAGPCLTGASLSLLLLLPSTSFSLNPVKLWPYQFHLCMSRQQLHYFPNRAWKCNCSKKPKARPLLLHCILYC